MLSAARNTLVSTLAALGLLLLAPAAQALTLADLVDGASFTTANGLTFDDFDVIITGDLPPDLADAIEVEVLSDGFQLIGGPIAVADGDFGDLFLTYHVSAESLEMGINGGSLRGILGATGVGALAAVDEVLLMDMGGSTIALLSISNTGGIEGEEMLDDATDPFAPRLELLVEKDVAVTTFNAGIGSSARISLIEQRFSVVPEPGTAGMLAVGLLGLAFAGRRR